ncbi:MAG: hypothetical protein AAFN77_24510 [Planctomycetota bacterium]
MASTSTITIIGKKLGENDYDAIVDFVASCGGTFDIDGFVQGALVDDDGMDFVIEPVNDRDPTALARSLIGSGRLSTMDCAIELDGKTRYYNFDYHYDDRLVITINSNRVELEDGMTDFNWHYKNLVSKLSGTVMEVESVVFCDDL